MTVVELKGRTKYEKGEHYLQSSLSTLQELADLLDNDRLTEPEKITYNRAYTTGQRQYDEAKKIRDQLLTQKKSIRKFLINLFVRKDARFYKVSYETFASIRRTSEDLTRRLLPDKSVNPASGSPGEEPARGHVSVCEENPREVEEASGSPREDPAQSHVSVCEENPREVVEVANLPPNEIIRGLNVEVHNEQEEQQVLVALNRIKNSREADEDDDDDDSQTITPKPSQSRPSSPTPSCTIVWNNYYFNRSIVSFDSELKGTALNNGVDGGSSCSLPMSSCDV
ncbi:uncharacterized protein BJ212DRAFT_1374644 [Suillus subaureus]|uniref:Uncharacterized protein n=1 Tax=Suillus subaureus TaxID=48587 RepID=A0A9P7JAT1_9AGAM|nr:uncharacterized protein BJ212DRAFT_1374644 [Suillus subaureus]KAG1811461.1 hypothetical protein BJ212DRAFT_1374644 [Suillus subaureus]